MDSEERVKGTATVTNKIKGCGLTGKSCEETQESKRCKYKNTGFGCVNSAIIYQTETVTITASKKETNNGTEKPCAPGE